MKNLGIIFEKAGISLNPVISSRNGKKIDLLFINNADGSIRWLWPAHVKKPLFLKFYNVSNVRSKIFSIAIKFIFLLGIQKILFRKKRVCLAPSAYSSSFFPINSAWTLFTGTPGPNRKAIFYVENNGQTSFLKVASTSNARKLCYNEAHTIDTLQGVNITSFTYPRIFHQGLDLLHLDDISNEGERSQEFNMTHMTTLQTLVELSGSTSALRDIPVWQEINEIIQNPRLRQDTRLPKGLVQKLSLLIEDFEETTLIETSIAHGDFTPWNMYEKKGRLHIYDWELSRDSMPLGFDAFHFMIQQGILSHRKNWADIHKEITNKISRESFATLSQAANIDLNLYLKLYLIINSILYLDIYSQQEKWHMQISWLLNVWNEALSTFMSDHFNHRELLLTDTFDFLANQPYAALKFPELEPRQLSEFSDVDLCMGRNSAVKLTRYLMHHPLVSHAKLFRRSNMINLQLICKNGSLLSIDCIWKLKRKATVMMDAQRIINHARLNKYGVKLADPKDEARYIGLFYTLNRAEIPIKYLDRSKLLSHSKEGIDQELFRCFQLNAQAKNSVIRQINQKKVNRHFSKFRNLLTYWADVFLSLFQHDGMVITFSGVDGAGKSTVIDMVKIIIEKKLRRKVVVIRHRPSILPILSAWVEGKAAAEKKAASTLPRQGKNKHWGSSLIRFSYYYTDYIIGQFVVYFKYVLRGYIVLYDRYYFDFINDSRRSNIQLPEFITKSGYKLLLKPDLNFFLYAAPELILSRKKELMASTIEQLTKKYLDLFERLNRDKAKSRYIPIENIVLEDTIESIIQRMIKIAA